MFLLLFIVWAGCLLKWGESYNSNYYVIDMPDNDSGKTTKKSFHVYWNVPTMQCSSKKIYFDNLYERFGIIQNKNDSFRGDKISLLYDPGSFPALFKNETSGEIKYRNGGVPQEGNLEMHLDAFRIVLDDSVPDQEFDGVGIIDFESWRPIFRQNFGALMPYQDISKDIERSRHMFWPEKIIKDEARRRFEEAGQVFMKTTLSLAKQMRPKAHWGYYAFPYCFNFGSQNIRQGCAKGVPEENDRINWLWTESTAIYPSVYSSHTLENDQLAELIRGRIKEALRTRKNGSPVLPYFWYRYRDSGYFSEKDLNTALKVFFNYADGFIIWGSSKDVDTPEKCLKLQNYIELIMGPAIAKYTKRGNILSDESTNAGAENVDTEKIKLSISNHKEPHNSVNTEMNLLPENEILLNNHTESKKIINYANNRIGTIFSTLEDTSLHVLNDSILIEAILNFVLNSNKISFKGYELLKDTNDSYDNNFMSNGTTNNIALINNFTAITSTDTDTTVNVMDYNEQSKNTVFGSNVGQNSQISKQNYKTIHNIVVTKKNYTTEQIDTTKTSNKFTESYYDYSTEPYSKTSNEMSVNIESNVNLTQNSKFGNTEYFDSIFVSNLTPQNTTTTFDSVTTNDTIKQSFEDNEISHIIENVENTTSSYFSTANTLQLLKNSTVLTFSDEETYENLTNMYQTNLFDTSEFFIKFTETVLNVKDTTLALENKTSQTATEIILINENNGSMTEKTDSQKANFKSVEYFDSILGSNVTPENITTTFASTTTNSNIKESFKYNKITDVNENGENTTLSFYSTPNTLPFLKNSTVLTPIDDATYENSSNIYQTTLSDTSGFFIKFTETIKNFEDRALALEDKISQTSTEITFKSENKGNLTEKTDLNKANLESVEYFDNIFGSNVTPEKITTTFASTTKNNNTKESFKYNEITDNNENGENTTLSFFSTPNTLQFFKNSTVLTFSDKATYENSTNMHQTNLFDTSKFFIKLTETVKNVEDRAFASEDKISQTTTEMTISSEKKGNLTEKTDFYKANFESIEYLDNLFGSNVTPENITTTVDSVTTNNTRKQSIKNDEISDIIKEVENTISSYFSTANTLQLLRKSTVLTSSDEATYESSTNMYQTKFSDTGENVKKSESKNKLEPESSKFVNFTKKVVNFDDTTLTSEDNISQTTTNALFSTSLARKKINSIQNKISTDDLKLYGVDSKSTLRSEILNTEVAKTSFSEERHTNLLAESNSNIQNITASDSLNKVGVTASSKNKNLERKYFICILVSFANCLCDVFNQCY